MLPGHSPEPSPPLAIHWRSESLCLSLESILPGIHLEMVPRAHSTNSLLLERLRRYLDTGHAPPKPCLLVAEEQTAGRGRLGRVWYASPGASLTFSLALPVASPHWEGLSLAVGVALAEAIDPWGSAPLCVGLKWPNDLWLLESLNAPATLCQDPKPSSIMRGRKLGGILVETVSCGGLRWAVIGVGLNVRPQAGADAAGLQTACWSEFDDSISVSAALARLAPPLLLGLRQFQSQGFSVFLDRFHRRDLLRGQEVTLSEGNFREGKALGVTASGALRVDFGGTIRLIHGGEVSVRLKSA
jgi:BirA family biotin operon repressor/biotin-[acetyl-CoA-carboxylase] ligase